MKLALYNDFESRDDELDNYIRRLELALLAIEASLLGEEHVRAHIACKVGLLWGLDEKIEKIGPVPVYYGSYSCKVRISRWHAKQRFAKLYK